MRIYNPMLLRWRPQVKAQVPVRSVQEVLLREYAGNHAQAGPQPKEGNCNPAWQVRHIFLILSSGIDPLIEIPVFEKTACTFVVVHFVLAL